MMLRIFLVLNIIFFLGCQNKINDPEAPVISIPQLVSLTGSSIQISTSDQPRLVESPIIVTDDGTPIPDGTQFNLVADVVKINNVDIVNSINWSSSMTVTSKDGKFSFYVKPHTIAGLYRVNAYPVSNPNIKFDQGLSARYFVNVVAGIPTSIGDIKTDLFQDKSPYNNLKDTNEDWIVSSNPDLVSYISVGPITDSYNNLVEQGEINLTINSGTIISENPSRIISGYAYFSYKSNGVIGDVNSSATIINHPLNPVLNKQNVIKKAAPQLSLSSVPDFTSMTVGQTRCQTVNLINNGAMPSTHLNIESSFPFNFLDENTSDPLCPLTFDVCRFNQSLRSGESCKLRIKFTMPNSSVSDGELIAQVNPQEFASSILIQKLRTQSVQAAQLVATNPFISFGGTQCSSTRTVDIVVENIGDYDATGLVVQNPPPNNNQSNPFYSIILPPEDVPMNSNLNSIVNCGTTFPAKRKCRVQVSFNPTAGILNQSLLGKILGTNINPLILSVSGYTIPGNALNTFPINFITPNNSLTPLGMFISNSQQSRVDVGPIVDACNQRVADGSILTASVSAGNLLQQTLVSNNGFASFYWNAGNDVSKIGNQTISISVGVNGSKNGTLLFRGIDLELSGNTNFNQVIEGKPKELTVTLTNNGNVNAQNISFNIGSPLVVVDSGSCNSGSLSSGASCQIIVKADPQGINQDLSIPLTITSSTLGQNNISQNFTLKARTKAILSLDSNEYLFNDGTNSTVYKRNITLKNNGPAVSYDTVINVESPFFIDSTNCSSTLLENTSCVITVGLNSVDASLAVDKKIKISNEVDVNSPVSVLAFSSLEFNQNSVLGIVNRCLGPYHVSIKGSSGTITSSSLQVINLSSVSNLITFFSNSSCNSGTEITSVNIPSGGTNSSNFYLKSSNVFSDNIISSNSVISSGLMNVQFNAEINLNVPNPNALVNLESLLLEPSGGYGNYSIEFSSGGLTSTYADIINETALDENGNQSPTGKKILSVKNITGNQSVSVKITDAQNFTKDFAFNLYQPLSGTNSITIQSSSPVLIPHNKYSNPNGTIFKIQNYTNGNYVDGSLYSSTIDSSGNFTAGSSIGSATEYVLIQVPKATGGFSEFRTTVVINLKWPFGTLGDLVINSGQTVNLNAGQSYDYNSITINSGGRLNIFGKGIILLGSVQNVVINGEITSDTFSDCGVTFSLTDPDVNNLTPLTSTVSQASGGAGGAGGFGVYYGYISGGVGGSGCCGYGGGGGGGGSTDGGTTGGSCGGAGGSSNRGGWIGYGGSGMSTLSHGANAANGALNNFFGSPFNNVGGAGGGSGGGGPTYWGGAGGGGGNKGYHKNSLFIRTKSSILGNGHIYLQGTNGFNGGYGGLATTCPSSTNSNTAGSGGSGGGGAGGSGGNVKFEYKNSITLPISNIHVQGGSGGYGASGNPGCSNNSGGGSITSTASGAGTNGSAGYSGFINLVLW